MCGCALHTCTAHIRISVCMYYILNYVSMFYKFIWYKYCLELAFHTFVRFPIAKLSLEMRHAERDGGRPKELVCLKEWEGEKFKKNDQKWDFFFLIFHLFLKSTLSKESGWNETFKSICVWVLARALSSRLTQTQAHRQNLPYETEQHKCSCSGVSWL